MIKKIGLGILASLVTALCIFGVVSAQSGDDPANPGQGPGNGPLSQGVEILAETLGVTVEELHEALADGQTVAELAEAQNVSLDSIVEALVRPAAEKMRERLENGQLPFPRPKRRQPKRGQNLLAKAGEIVAGELGMTVQDLREALDEGQSVADLAEAQGVPLDDILNALLEPVTEHLDQAVADGKLTQEEADAKLAEVTERLSEQLENDDLLANRPSRRPGNRTPRPNRQHLETIAEVLGMEAEDLREALVDGQTVAEIAEAQGVSLDTIVEALLAPAVERLNQAVADGKMTQEEADAKLEELTDRLREQLENGGPRSPRSGQGPMRNSNRSTP